MRRPKRSWAMLLATAFLVGTGGYAATAAPPPPRPIPNLWMTALGDSVASGEGSNYGWVYTDQPFLADGYWTAQTFSPNWERSNISNACHVSKEGYPYKVKAAFSWSSWNFTCSGATATNGVLARQTGLPGGETARMPQLGSKTILGSDPPNVIYQDPYPDVVTLTLGADDLRFGEVVTACYKSFLQPSILGCDQDKQLNLDLDARLIRQKTNLDLVIGEILRQNPAGHPRPTIFLTSYYDPFPDGGEYAACRDIRPVAGTFGLSTGEIKWLKKGLSRLNTNIRQVATKYKQDVQLVKLEEAFKGHKWCSSDPYIYGPSIAMIDGQGSNPSPFHPTAAGQQVIADLVIAKIKAHFKF